MKGSRASGRRKGARGGQEAVYGHAVQAVIQILFVTRLAYTVDSLRDKLREFFLEETDYEKRAAASLSAIELLDALMKASPTLAAVGLQLRISNGVVQLATTRVASASLGEFLAKRSERVGALSSAALEVLACVAFKQPISQSEIDRLFGRVDKRHLVFVLREAEMIEAFPDGRGGLRYATTGAFLRHFGLESIAELQVALQEQEKPHSGFFGFL